MLSEVIATRYVTPLREGGSLPGIVEADDLGTYVMKFTGASASASASKAVGHRGPDPSRTIDPEDCTEPK
ncbi:hypothetical protein ACFWA0_24390, partial [Streptomyces xanthophaeus]